MSEVSQESEKIWFVARMVASMTLRSWLKSVPRRINGSLVETSSEHLMGLTSKVKFQGSHDLLHRQNTARRPVKWLLAKPVERKAK